MRILRGGEAERQRPLDRIFIAVGHHGTRRTLLGGAATCSEGFLICFLKVPFDCLGSMAAAVMPGELSEKNLRNKWLPHPIQEGTVIAE